MTFWSSLILLTIWPRISETIPYLLFLPVPLLSILMFVQAHILIKKPIADII